MSRELPTVVIGGGLLGVSTLFELTRRGRPAILVEANESLAGETSYANGGMLTASMPDPWNSPGVGRHLVASLFDPYAATKLRLKAVPGMMFWGLSFLRNSAPARHRETTRQNYQLARYSVDRTRALAEELNLDYAASNAGTLKVFESKQALEPSRAVSDLLTPLGLEYEVLTTDEVLAKEPALSHVRQNIACGLYYPGDSSGDAHAFTNALAERALGLGAEIRSGTRVKRVLTKRRAVCGVETDRGRVEAAAVVIAAGVHSPSLARSAGINLAIRPAKGYSVTVDVSGSENTPSIPIIDDAMHAAITPLGDRLRFVGTAEFAGFDTSIAKERIDNLFELLNRLYPHLAGRIDKSLATYWAGLRAMTADGRAYVGKAGADGLWVNTGHGHLGWTMAVGSAELLVSQMCGENTPVDPAPFAADR